MPKGKRKGKSDRKYERYVQTSDDDSMIDNESLISGDSEGTEEADEVSQQVFEEKLIEAVDGLSQKSAQGRTNCFAAVEKAFVCRYSPDFVYDRRLTISDCIEHGLRKGRTAEQAAAAQLIPLLYVQLGPGDAAEEITRTLKPILFNIANDKTAAVAARIKCCVALGLLTFLAGGDMGDVLELMHSMQTIFSGSYLKGDGSIPNVSAETASLHAAALSSWTLLLTLMTACDVYSMIGNNSSFQPSLNQLSDLLQSPHLEVRLSAGEALATVFEMGRDCHDDFAEDFVVELVEILRNLATDSHKYRAKKDRKQQRATFRDILHYIENDSFSDVQVKFGTEVLVLDTWMRRKQYDSLCHALGPGLNIHLAENELLRDIFELGDKIIVGEVPIKKSNKLERHLMNAAAFKARTISRAKNRDKRSDF